MDFSFKKAIVTGGAGFVGSHLVETLVTMGVETISIDNYFAGKHENLRYLYVPKESRSCGNNKRYLERYYKNFLPGPDVCCVPSRLAHLHTIPPHFPPYWVNHKETHLGDENLLYRYYRYGSIDPITYSIQCFSLLHFNFTNITRILQYSVILILTRLSLRLRLRRKKVP